ncbi:hypothetical protein ACLK2F_21750 [Escherichia coli]
MVTGKRGKTSREATGNQCCRQRRKVTATVISYDNYVTILDEETLKAWIAKLKKRQYCRI